MDWLIVIFRSPDMHLKEPILHSRKILGVVSFLQPFSSSWQLRSFGISLILFRSHHERAFHVQTGSLDNLDQFDDIDHMRGFSGHTIQHEFVFRERTSSTSLTFNRRILHGLQPGEGRPQYTIMKFLLTARTCCTIPQSLQRNDSWRGPSIHRSLRMLLDDTFRCNILHPISIAVGIPLS